MGCLLIYGAYVEKNLRTVKGIKLIPLYNVEDAKRDREMLSDPLVIRDVLLELGTQQDLRHHSLDDILNDETLLTEPSNNASENNEAYEADDVRSIIGFSMLLQHVLRLFVTSATR